MTITLLPDQEEAIAKAIESGAYQNADQVIERALEVLRSEDEWLRNSKNEINRKIDRAFRQFEHGDFYTAEESRAKSNGARPLGWLLEAAKIDSLYEVSLEAQNDGDLTDRPALFFALYSFVVVYQPDPPPIRIMAILRGRRNVRRILQERL